MSHEWYTPEICHPFEEKDEDEDFWPAMQLLYSPPNKHGEEEEDCLGFNTISFLTVRVVLSSGLVEEFHSFLVDTEFYIDTSIPITGPGAFGITITRKVDIISW
jgi:hypothetical protein